MCGHHMKGREVAEEGRKCQKRSGTQDERGREGKREGVRDCGKEGEGRTGKVERSNKGWGRREKESEGEGVNSY